MLFNRLNGKSRLMQNGKSECEGAVSKLKIYPNGIEKLANENCLL